MVFSDHGYGARLRALLAFAFMEREADFHAGLQLVEFGVENAVGWK